MLTLDLQKYGLSYLEEKNVKDWSDYDIDKLLNASENENIAPTVDIHFRQDNVEKLLSKSYCRRCGKCCLPNPLDPDHPGVMVYEKDLRLIAKHSSYSYKYLKKKAVLNTDPSLARCRHFPLPCMFYKKGECQIYDVRPFICRIYPLIESPRNGELYIAINVRCDYGKDLYKFVVSYLKTMNKNPFAGGL